MKAKTGTGCLNAAGYHQFHIKGKLKYGHIIIAEKAIGKKLPIGAEVHHVDGNKSNNTPSNLVICPDKRYHTLLHRRMNALQESGNPNNLKCTFCKKWDAPENLKQEGLATIHIDCRNAYQRDRRLKKSKTLGEYQ